MQFQVPQFIETDDKVIGPLSLRQFAFVGVACFISAFFYFFVSFWLFIIAAVVLIGSSLALSFVKIEGRPLPQVVLAAVSYYWKPQTYVWQPEHPTVSLPQKKSAPPSSSRAVLPPKATPAPVVAEKKEKGISLDQIADIIAGSSLHKKLQSVQTGEATKKTSDRQFLERKMNERYHIFTRPTGDRAAARRVDYR
ncbi:MAG TPA: PrgI family protein [Candidatus Paceibacterota bacterium]|nr:PrgI family protein [Candidatus Paceibacterota bacterium]